jgi:DNA-binding GntR family transcriptional regulator
MVLKRQGLIEVHPQRGSFVFDMDATQVRKLSELREVLELAAIRMVLASDRKALARQWADIVGKMRKALDADDAELYRTLDGGFHRVLFELADNAFLLDAYELIAFRIQALRNCLSRAPTLNATSFEEHVGLAELVAGGEDEAAIDLMSRHIAATREHYLEAMKARTEDAPGTAPKGRRRTIRR